MLFKKYSKRKRILIISGLSFLGILLLLFASAEYTSRPKFCTTCHYMKPFYESWATSTHKDVPCVKCHYAPGFKSVIETKTVGLVVL
jgi:cytochrome c nitrite reductase small subunit